MAKVDTDKLLRSIIKDKTFHVKLDHYVPGDHPDITFKKIDPYYFVMLGNYFLDYIHFDAVNVVVEGIKKSSGGREGTPRGSGEESE